jgi:dipeptidyl aminopeptidase/acylaminoacyl peptidase
MAAANNKGGQFFVTMAVFLLLFIGFYFFMTSRGGDKEGEKTAYEVAYINDGAAYLSGPKGENPLKVAISETVAWAPAGDGCYYIDNYAKLKSYDIAAGESKDVAVNVASFAVPPTGDLIAVVEKDQIGSLKIITAAGEAVADLGAGTSPRWFASGDRIAYISGKTIFVAAGGDWNSYPLYEGSPTELAVSPDGKSIMFVEWAGTESRLMLLSVATRTAERVKEAAFDSLPTDVSPLGFSSPRFVPDGSAALFLYNDAKGGRVYRYDLEKKSVTGVSAEPGPIWSLSVSSTGELVAYFFVFTENLPKFTEKKDGKETPMVFGPKDMNPDFVTALYARGEKDEIGGEKLNNYNTRRLLDGDVIRVVDLKKDVFWPLGSGQYPMLK